MHIKYILIFSKKVDCGKETKVVPSAQFVLQCDSDFPGSAPI